MSIHDRTERKAGYVFILIFAIMAMGIVLIGYFHYLNYEQDFRANVESELSSIAQLKVGELAQWRKERLGDGAVLFKNTTFSELVRRFLEQPGDVDAQRQLQAWMGKYLTAYQYTRVYLLDTQGRMRMSVPEAPKPYVSSIAKNVTGILRSGKVAIEDFHRNTPDGPVHLAVVVPIFDSVDESRPLGVLSLHIDPTTYLYSFISKWPTPSQTAETLLVRKDGDDALFLSELRFRENAPLNLRIPLTKTEVPAVRAALGQTGVMEGVDYRGAPVIVAAFAVSDSPWVMVARINTSEVYAPLRKRLWEMVTFVCVLLFGSGAAMGFVWRQKSARYRERDKVAELAQKRLDEISELYQLGNAVSGADTLEAVYSAAKSSILRVLKADRVSILLFDSEGVMRFESWQGLSDTYRESADGHSPWAQDAVNPAPVLVNDIELDADWESFRPVAAAEGIRAFAFIPLALDNRLIGKFMVYFNKPHHFTESEIKIAGTIAFHIAFGVERKRAEEAIHMAELRYRSIFTQAADAIWVIDAQTGAMVEFNTRAYESLGYTREEFGHIKIADVELLETADEVALHVRKVIEEGSDVFETKHRTRNGETRDVLVSANTITLGGRTYLQAILRDITERKKVEEELKKTVEDMELYRLIIEKTGDPVFMIDDDDGCRMIYVNEAAVKHYKAPLEEILTWRIPDWDPNFTYEKLPAHVEEIKKFKNLFIESVHRVKGGEIVPVEISLNLINYKGHTCHFGYFKNITERKRMEEEKTAHIRYLTSVNQIYREFEPALDLEKVLPVALNKLLSIFDCDRAWLLYPLDADAKTYKIPFEQTKPEYPGAGKSHQELPVTKEVAGIFEATLNASAPVSMNLAEGITDESQLKEFDIKTQLVAPIYPKTGKPWMIGLHQCSRVREWTKEDQALFHAISLVISDKLNNLLLVKNLGQAKEQAEAATKLKDQFVSMVAHDLRSPFTSMMGLIKHVTNQKPDSLNEEDGIILNAALKSGDRMLAMIEDLLKISRLQTGDITPQPRFFKGHMAVAVTIGSISHLASQKGVVIINDIPLDMRLYADQALFDEVLLNLLSNAIKFCASGDKITFFIPPGLKGAIAIRDTGKGVNEKIIPNLFKHEVKTTTSGTAGEMGTGLGLPYSYDIMKAHGGEITVESAPGKGSVFCVMLPYVRPIALVVDDEPMTLMVVRNHLEKIGIDVVSALNGEQALTALKDKRPHVIITDINMPEMDGFELLDRLKKESATRDIPVIVMTSADGEARENSFRHGADDFVSKPIEVEDFIPRVRRFVG